ncbi:MAG TPA: ankyrin repeat domain-containing protein [Pseudobacteroides sp.]|uniref:ankyrin repeat domain-containing protein n=1 Tax=Pseudobacteroides sp. TaxID=1968840 RepID=UPI002F95B613
MKKLFISIIVLCFITILSSTLHSHFFTDIVDSARAGNIKRLTRQLDDKSYTATNLKNALFAAIANHRTQAVSTLIKYVDLNNGNYSSNGDTPLIAALKYLDVVKVLVDGGADVSLPSETNRLPLEYAVINRNYDAAEYLLTKGCNPNINNWFTDLWGSSPDIMARGKKLIPLLVENGADLRKELGRKVLGSVVQMEDYKLVDYLLKNGCSNHIPKIFPAYYLPSSKMYIYLLEKGIPIDGENAFASALNLAAGGKIEALEYYFDNCPKLDESQLRDTTVSAYGNNNFEIIKLLVSKGYKIKKDIFINMMENAITSMNFDMLEKVLNYSNESKGTKNEIFFDENTISKLKANLLRQKEEQSAWFDFTEKRNYDMAYELLDKY